MQTFLPYPSFARSAKVLDKKRCWQQVREAKAIISILENPTRESRYRNHPAVRQWKGYVPALKLYYDIFLVHCKVVHKINTKFQLIGTKDPKSPNFLPLWIGYEPFHASHRARLLAKNFSFYSQYKWKEDPNEAYIWPVDKSNKLLPEIEEWILKKSYET